jgi:hypothetical protein
MFGVLRPALLVTWGQLREFRAVYPRQRTVSDRARPVVLRQTQTARREHPGPHRPHRIPRIGQHRRTRLDPRHHRRPQTRPANPLPGRRPRTHHPDRQGLRRRRNRHPGSPQGPQPRPQQPDRNTIINALRAPAERANALLQRTWKALETRHSRPPGESARSPPPPSYYSTFNDQPVRKPHRNNSGSGWHQWFPLPNSERCGIKPGALHAHASHTSHNSPT